MDFTVEGLIVLDCKPLKTQCYIYEGYVYLWKDDSNFICASAQFKCTARASVTIKNDWVVHCPHSHSSNSNEVNGLRFKINLLNRCFLESGHPYDMYKEEKANDLAGAKVYPKYSLIKDCMMEIYTINNKNNGQEEIPSKRKKLSNLSHNKKSGVYGTSTISADPSNIQGNQFINAKADVFIDPGGKRYCIHNSYVYSDKLIFLGSFLVGCTEKNCPAWGVLANNTFFPSLTHTHEPIEYEADRTMLHSILKNCSSTETLQLSSIYLREVVKNENFIQYCKRTDFAEVEGMMKAYRRVRPVFKPYNFKVDVCTSDNWQVLPSKKENKSVSQSKKSRFNSKKTKMIKSDSTIRPQMSASADQNITAAMLKEKPFSDRAEIFIDPGGERYYIHDSYVYKDTITFMGRFMVGCKEESCPAWGVLVENTLFLSMNHIHVPIKFDADTTKLESILKNCTCTERGSYRKIFNKVVLNNKHLEVKPVIFAEVQDMMKVYRNVKPLFSPYTLQVDVLKSAIGGRSERIIQLLLKHLIETRTIFCTRQLVSKLEEFELNMYLPQDIDYRNFMSLYKGLPELIKRNKIEKIRFANEKVKMNLIRLSEIKAKMLSKYSHVNDKTMTDQEKAALLEFISGHLRGTYVNQSFEYVKIGDGENNENSAETIASVGEDDVSSVEIFENPIAVDEEDKDNFMDDSNVEIFEHPITVKEEDEEDSCDKDANLGLNFETEIFFKDEEDSRDKAANLGLSLGNEIFIKGENDDEDSSDKDANLGLSLGNQIFVKEEEDEENSPDKDANLGFSFENEIFVKVKENEEDSHGKDANLGLSFGNEIFVKDEKVEEDSCEKDVNLGLSLGNEIFVKDEDKLICVHLKNEPEGMECVYNGVIKVEDNQITS